MTFIRCTHDHKKNKPISGTLLVWFYVLHLHNICYCFRFLNWSKLQQTGVYLSQMLIFSSEGRRHSSHMQSGNRNWSLWYWSPWAESTWMRWGWVNPNRRLLLQGQSYTGRQHMLNTFWKTPYFDIQISQFSVGKSVTIIIQGSASMKTHVVFLHWLNV